MLMLAVALYDWIRHPFAQGAYNAFEGHPAFRAFALFVGAPIVALLGIMVLRQQRDNVVGLLLLAWAGGFGSYAISVDIQPALYNVVSFPITAWWTAFIFMAFFFPDGKAYPRWLTPFLLLVMVWAIVHGLTAVASQPFLEYAGSPSNPLYVPGAEIADAFTLRIYFGMGLPLIAGIFISPWLRYRQAGSVQRQQIKGFTWWSILLLTPYVFFYVITVTRYPNAEGAPPLLKTVLGAFIGLIGLGPPLIVGYSILRHKLFDIDVVIRRTLVYAVVTALLGFVFYGSIILLQRLFTGLTGQESPVAIVASTLIIAALFSPLRARVQNFIDRRFYRRKYDAQRVLADFAAVARNETDVDRLTRQLSSAVEAALKPELIHLWLPQKDRE
jgi:hypothetical protein